MHPFHAHDLLTPTTLKNDKTIHSEGIPRGQENCICS